MVRTIFWPGLPLEGAAGIRGAGAGAGFGFRHYGRSSGCGHRSGGHAFDQCLHLLGKHGEEDGGLVVDGQPFGGALGAVVLEGRAPAGPRAAR